MAISAPMRLKGYGPFRVAPFTSEGDNRGRFSARQRLASGASQRPTEAAGRHFEMTATISPVLTLRASGTD